MCVMPCVLNSQFPLAFIIVTEILELKIVIDVFCRVPKRVKDYMSNYRRPQMSLHLQIFTEWKGTH